MKTEGWGKGLGQVPKNGKKYSDAFNVDRISRYPEGRNNNDKKNFQSKAKKTLLSAVGVGRGGQNASKI
jgi:hypothetical protein